ncbi:probable receptor-like protein kinase At5g20050 [Selaginella moellendorffii]|nr:probable receptor-like protein kinase At5g20050 [Selaginella moellendorffii]XP_024515347.1 probable receptor-like protein kinase At5g20050 [Selaginella moellendorffii]|eukprot:XP_024515346.1 probable receptor-like protein kinase At5g20050 [Selaginella moellendorffii]
MRSGNRSLRAGSCLDDSSAGACNICAPSSTLIYNGTQMCPECCVPGLAYRFYACSPPLQIVNRAVLYSTTFNENLSCTDQIFSIQDQVVSLSSGWIQRNFSICLTNINITAPNNRSVVAKIVDECSSKAGCTAGTAYWEPCAPNAIAGTPGVWSALGYDPGDGILRDVSWSKTNASVSASGGGGGGGSKKKNTGAIAASAVVGFVLFAMVPVGFYWIKIKARLALRRRNQEQVEEISTLVGLPKQFSYHCLQKATRNFAKKSMLGEGGFGMVFKGNLSDGTTVAVKRMDVEIEGSNEGQQQFKAEVLSIGSIRHYNLVQLRGFCIHGPSSLLVYEYMSNGALDKWIFPKDSRFLDWSQRHQVAVDVARGLAYLHEGCREQVLHLDIKPQNILLDENLRARIADFGLSKLAERGKSYAVTAMRGTPGYMAPEWLHTKVTDRTDVYSFGIVLLELLSSRKSLEIQKHSSSVASTSGASSSASSQGVFILGHTAARLFHSGDVATLVDRDLEVDLSVAERFAKIGLWCIQEDPAKRPSIGNALAMLEGDLEVGDLPPPPPSGANSPVLRTPGMDSWSSSLQTGT